MENANLENLDSSYLSNMENPKEEDLSNCFSEIIRAYSLHDKNAIKNMESLALKYNYGKAISFLGCYYQFKKNNECFDKAVLWLNLAVNYPNLDISTNAIYNLGILYDSKGDYEKAKEYYKRAIEKGCECARKALEEMEKD